MMYIHIDCFTVIIMCMRQYIADRDTGFNRYKQLLLYFFFDRHMCQSVQNKSTFTSILRYYFVSEPTYPFTATETNDHTVFCQKYELSVWFRVRSVWKSWRLFWISIDCRKLQQFCFVTIRWSTKLKGLYITQDIGPICQVFLSSNSTEVAIFGVVRPSVHLFCIQSHICFPCR